MNFLAHLYLSGDDEQVKVGNFVADWVKGKDLSAFPERIRQGIVMHRHIDSFTDSHPLVKETKALFYASHRRYAGIVTDIVYDHYLSVNWASYSNIGRLFFIDEVHDILCRYHELLPGRSRVILPALIYEGWLKSYVSLHGVQRVLARMSVRTSLPDMTAQAVSILRGNYPLAEKQFTSFFEDLRDYVAKGDFLSARPSTG